MVGDRGLMSERSLRARALRAIDRRAFRAADLVVADTAAHAAVLRSAVRHSGGATGRLLRRSRGSPVSTRRALGRRVHRAVRRQAHPAPRGRDDPSRGVRMSRDCVPHRRERPARPSPRRDPGERSSRARGWSTTDFPICTAPRDARSASSARRKGRTRHPEQGLPGSRDGNAARSRATRQPARELLEDGRDALLVPPGNPEALAQAIRRVASDPGLVLEHRRTREDDIRGERVRDGARRTGGESCSSGSSQSSSDAGSRERAGSRGSRARPRRRAGLPIAAREAAGQRCPPDLLARSAARLS